MKLLLPPLLALGLVPFAAFAADLSSQPGIIKHVVVDPEKLQTRPIIDGQWPE